MSLWKKPLLIVSAVLALGAFAAPNASAEVWSDGSNNPLAEAQSVSGDASLAFRVHAGINVICDGSTGGYLWNEETAQGFLTQFGNEGAGPSCVFQSSWFSCPATATTNFNEEEGPMVASVGGPNLQVGNIEIDVKWNKGCATGINYNEVQIGGSITGQWDDANQRIVFAEAKGLTDPFGYPLVTSGHITLENAEVGPLTLQ